MKYSQRIQELPPDERPYEKCLHSGPEKLTDSELLAVVLRSGTRGSSSVQLADEVLHLGQNEQGLLGIYHLSMEDLMQIRGIGQVKAVQIKCIGELSKRIATREAKNFWIFTVRTQLQRIIWNGCGTKSRSR